MVDASAAAAAESTAKISFPGILRRLAGMAYEALLLAAILFISTYVFLTLGQTLDDAWRRPLLQVYLVCVCGIYFVWMWRHGGQTLPMKTWHMRLVNIAGGRLSPGQALARFLLACVLIPAGGVSILWALFDRDRQFLHDRLAGTRIVNTSG